MLVLVSPLVEFERGAVGGRSSPIRRVCTSGKRVVTLSAVMVVVVDMAAVSLEVNDSEATKAHDNNRKSWGNNKNKFKFTARIPRHLRRRIGPPGPFSL